MIIFRIGKIASALVLGCSTLAWISGCIFDSKLPGNDGPQSYQTYISSVLDTLYPSGATPARVVELYQPLLDSSMASGKTAPVEVFSPINVKDHGTKEIVQYRVSRQRFGSWNNDLEFKWTLFLLKSNFLFPESIPDTAGLAEQLKPLFDGIHAQDLFTKYFDSLAAPGIWNLINSSTKPGAIGVGVKLSSGNDTILIKEVVANSPAGHAGIAPGMAILAINDSTVVGDSAMNRFQKFSPGDSGSAVTLTLLGPQGVFSAHLVREPVAFPTVLVDSLQGVGYINITGFTPNTLGANQSTATEFHDALIATRKFPVTILDLRDNGGGSLDIAMKMCDEILPADTIIIRQLQRRYDETTHAPIESQLTAFATAGGVGETAPSGDPRKYLLLGNGKSASASEIFLVSMMEGAKAPLMGQKTYGKGVGQTVRNTPGKGLALVTFLKFTSRSGLDYHKIGLMPTFPDSTTLDTLLAHAVLRAQTLAGSPSAKVGAMEGEASMRNPSAARQKDLRKRAAAVEWNRREAARPGLRDLQELIRP